MMVSFDEIEMMEILVVVPTTSDAGDFVIGWCSGGGG
jgi:hypothetical protein